ncbi:MAG: hypothetical protein ACW98K_17375 [Candidatus Kariarchaeaceae archaeon]|jgi:DNA-binding PadR family transcriptional regulator
MILYAVYVITNDGREILSEIFQSPENVPNQSILSGLLSAFQSMSDEITKKEGSAEKLSLSGLIYHIRNYGDFMVVIVTDADSAPAKILDSIGWRFMRQFGEELDRWTGNQTMFEGFRGTISEIVSKHIDEMRAVDPNKRLDTTAIFELPKELQSTALVIASLEKATSQEIADEVSHDVETVEKYLDLLHMEGYIGVRDEDGKTLYFCST